MKPAPGSPTDRLWLALPCSFLGRFMAPRGISYFFLGTHACPASLVSLREFRFSSAGWCGSGVRIAPTLWVLSGGCYRVCIQILLLCGKLDVATLLLVFLVPHAMAISTSFLLFPVYNNYLTSLMLMARYTLLDQV